MAEDLQKLAKEIITEGLHKVEEDDLEEETRSQLIQQFEEYLEREEERRDEELLKFLEDFINSQEAEEFLERKRNMIKEDRAVQVSGYSKWTQYNRRDLLLPEFKRKPKVIVYKYPLTEEAKRKWRLQELLDKKKRRKIVREIICRQEEAVRILREKMTEEEKLRECHKKERLKMIEEQRQKVLNSLADIYGIDVSLFNSKHKVVDKVLTMRRLKKIAKIQRRKRVMSIVEKIVKEERRRRQIERQQRKIYYGKAPPDKILRKAFLEGIPMILV